jgi:hypothetical protein
LPNPKQHHTVPAAYLAGFLNDPQAMLHVYSRDGRNFRGRPDALSSRRHYYGVRRNDGTVDNRVEQVLANEVEDDGLAILRKLCNGDQVSATERYRFAVYMAFQYLRTPHMRSNIEQSYAEVLNALVRKRMKGARQFDREISAACQLRIEDVRKARSAFLRGDVDLKAKPEFSLEAMFTHVDTYAHFLYVSRWEVTQFPRAQLITSDCPLHFRSAAHITLVDPATVIHYPLTAKNMLVISAVEPEAALWEKLSHVIPKPYLDGFVVWHNHVSYRNADAAEAEALNRITASMCLEYIYSAEESDTLPPLLQGASQNVKIQVNTEGEHFALALEAGCPQRE